MQQKDVFNQFLKFLKETDGDFHILEQRISVEIQMEYFKFSNQLRKSFSPIEDLDYDQFVSDLHNPESTKEYKQEILSKLAISKKIKAYRILEKYAQAPDPELTDWAYMALMESRMTLESDLSDGKQIYISTGLGGKGNKLRFYVLLLSASGNPFLDYQRKVIEREFDYAFSFQDCEIERLTVNEKYAELFILVPIQLDLKKIIDNIISECNQYGNFLSDLFTITNVKELSEDEIYKILNKHGNNQTSL